VVCDGIERNVSDQWAVIQNAVLQSAENNIGYNKRKEITKTVGDARNIGQNG